MTDMPDFVRRAIEAQGKVDPDEILEQLEDDEDGALLGVVYPPVEGQETFELGPVEPADHA